MNPEEQPGSLADQAAAWVPPWQRLVAPVIPELAEEPATDEPADEPADEPVDEPVAVDEPVVDVVVEDDFADAVELDEDGAIDEGLTDLIGDRDAEEDAEEAVAEATEEDVAPASEVEEAPDEAFDLKGALEAILLVVDEPVTEETLAQVLNVPVASIAARLAATSAEYTASGRGFDLRRVAGGWRLYTRGEFAAYVERFVLDGQSVRLTQAALETLAVIAYQQPVTRSRISAIRGVNCDGTVRTLVTRGLIEECGTQPESGAFLYRTTSVFLEKLGLDSVDELPPLAPFLPDDVNGFADAQR